MDTTFDWKEFLARRKAYVTEEAIFFAGATRPRITKGSVPGMNEEKTQEKTKQDRPQPQGHAKAVSGDEAEQLR
jgi:hypothetical protein